MVERSQELYFPECAGARQTVDRLFFALTRLTGRPEGMIKINKIPSHVPACKHIFHKLRFFAEQRNKTAMFQAIKQEIIQ